MILVLVQSGQTENLTGFTFSDDSIKVAVGSNIKTNQIKNMESFLFSSIRKKIIKTLFNKQKLT